MRDGPHRTLPLSSDWKRAAERLDNGNYSPAEVCGALHRAVQRDWADDVTPTFLDALTRILREPQPDMHRTMTAQLDELLPQAAGHCVRSALLEAAHDLEPAWHEDDWEGAVRGVLQGVVSRRRNQIVAHYRSKAPARVRPIERRLDSQRQEIEGAVARMASEIATGRGPVMAAPRKRSGLDDGVAL